MDCNVMCCICCSDEEYDNKYPEHSSTKGRNASTVVQPFQKEAAHHRVPVPSTNIIVGEPQEIVLESPAEIVTIQPGVLIETRASQTPVPAPVLVSPTRSLPPPYEIDEDLAPANPFMPEKDYRMSGTRPVVPSLRAASALDLAEDAPVEVMEAIRTPTKSRLGKTFGDDTQLPGAAVYSEPEDMTIII